MSTKGTLYLLPMPLGDEWEGTIPPQALNIMHELDFFLAEYPRTARRWMTQFMDVQIRTFETFNKRSGSEEIGQWMERIAEGKSIGYLSEAGMPCIADPGRRLVERVHQIGGTVKPIPGSSAILMALVGSGFNGQKFRFNGYLPPDSRGRERGLQQIERDSQQFRQTELFMETPYRNTQLIQSAFSVLDPSTRFSIAAHLTQKDEWIKSMSISAWKKEKLPMLHKIPAVFCLEAKHCKK